MSRTPSPIRLAVLCLAIIVAGCSRAPTDTEARHTIVEYLNGIHMGSESVDMNRLCASAGRQSSEGAFLGVGDVTQVGPKRVMAQGLFHWYVKTVWPVKASMHVKCGEAAYDTVTADQEFELEYDSDARAWHVSETYWNPWVENPTESDVLLWDFYAALIVGALAGFVTAIRTDERLSTRVGLGATMGFALGWAAAIAFAIYAGFRYQIAEYTDKPGLGTAIGLAFLAFFIGFFGGGLGGLAGSLAGARLVKGS